MYSETKSCDNCRHKRMCHKRQDADCKLAELATIAGRDMDNIPSEDHIKAVPQLGSIKAAYLNEHMKPTRAYLITFMANTCNSYEKQYERITAEEFKALPDSSDGLKVGDCFVCGQLRERQQNIKAGDKAFAMQLKKVEDKAIDIELVLFMIIR